MWKITILMVHHELDGPTSIIFAKHRLQRVQQLLCFKDGGAGDFSYSETISRRLAWQSSCLWKISANIITIIISLFYPRQCDSGDSVVASKTRSLCQDWRQNYLTESDPKIQPQTQTTWSTRPQFTESQQTDAKDWRSCVYPIVNRMQRLVWFCIKKSKWSFNSYVLVWTDLDWKSFNLEDDL